MGASNFDGPVFTYGAMGYLPSNVGGSPVPSYNQDAGPSGTYMGEGILDPRFPFLKDKVQGYQGVVPCFLNLNYIQSVEQVPAAFGTANIATLQNAANATPLNLVTVPGVGVATNIPIIPFGPTLNAGASVIAPIVLDFGFAFGATTAANTTITVADSTQFVPGMPLVIAAVGNAGGTAALLTYVTGTPTPTTITVNDAPAASNAAAPIGAGNIWMPSGAQNAAEPTAHLPYMAAGPALLLDPAGSIARGVSITGSTSGTGGAFTVRGWDIYWQPMTETITAGAGAVTTYGRKAFKAIASVTPGFSDAHAYSVGTSDMFGIHMRSDKWEYTNIFWNSAFMASSQGWTAGVTAPATGTTGDVRGTVQTSAVGSTPGGGIGANASNGVVAGLVMSGRRLAIFSSLPLYNTIRSTPFNTTPMFGAAQFAG